MSRPFLDGVGVLVDAVGAPLANGSVEFYVSPGSTPAEVYTSQALTTSAGATVALDATGIPSSVVWFDPDVTYKAVVKSAAGATVRTIDPVSATETAAALGFRNRLVNGAFSINQRAPATNADDTYAHDRWYVLTQSNAIAVTRLTDPESGAPTGARLTQSNAAAQRMGYAQIIESINCRDLRSAITTLSGRVRLSTTADLRYAVLEHTATADAVTSDVVLDWGSASYTAGGFFIAGVNVLAVGEVACTAATWRDLTELNATPGASLNNIIVVVWTEATVVQNVTLDINRIQLERGAIASPFEAREVGVELKMCQRYFQRRDSADSNVAGFGAGYENSSTVAHFTVDLAAPMRTAPTLTSSAASTFVMSSASGDVAGTSIALSRACGHSFFVALTHGGGTAGRGAFLRANTTTAAYFEAGAEL